MTLTESTPALCQIKPKITQEQNCDQLQLVTFNGLDTGVMYRVGCTCRFQGVVRTITRSFSTPHSHLTAMPTSSILMMEYHISTTLLREMQPPASCGTVPAIHLDSVAASTQGHLSPVSSHLVCVCVYLCVHVFDVGESPLYRKLSVAQHTIKISPQGCPGDAMFLFRRFDVPMDGFATPFSID